MYVKPLRFLYRASLHQGDDMYEIRLLWSFEGCSAVELITKCKWRGVQIDSNVIFFLPPTQSKMRLYWLTGFHFSICMCDYGMCERVVWLWPFSDTSARFPASKWHHFGTRAPVFFPIYGKLLEHKLYCILNRNFLYRIASYCIVLRHVVVKRTTSTCAQPSVFACKSIHVYFCFLGRSGDTLLSVPFLWFSDFRWSLMCHGPNRLHLKCDIIC